MTIACTFTILNNNVNNLICLPWPGMSSFVVSMMIPICIGEKFVLPEMKMTTETFPWSALFTGLGSLFALTAASLNIALLCKWDTYLAENKANADKDKLEMSELCDSIGDGSTGQRDKAAKTDDVVFYTGRGQKPEHQYSELNRKEYLSKQRNSINSMHRNADNNTNRSFELVAPALDQPQQRHFLWPSAPAVDREPEPRLDRSYGISHFSDSKKYRDDDVDTRVRTSWGSNDRDAIVDRRVDSDRGGDRGLYNPSYDSPDKIIRGLDRRDNPSKFDRPSNSSHRGDRKEPYSMYPRSPTRYEGQDRRGSWDSRQYRDERDEWRSPARQRP